MGMLALERTLTLVCYTSIVDFGGLELFLSVVIYRVSLTV